MRQMFQALEHAVDSPADPLGHKALPVPVLRETIPPEVRHEETYLHTYRFVQFSFIPIRYLFFYQLLENPKFLI